MNKKPTFDLRERINSALSFSSAPAVRMQEGGQTITKEYIDSVLNKNKNLNWVKRLYQKNTPSIVIPGQNEPSTHFMQSADNIVYPTIVQKKDGSLEYLGDKAYDYAIKTGEYIEFPSEKEANDFAINYKMGTNVLNQLNKEETFQGGALPEIIITAPRKKQGGTIQEGGTVNRLQQMMGYKDNSPYKNLPYQDIYSDRITMSGVSRPLVATTDTGVRTVMQPGGEYYFPGATQVRETPLYSNGGGTKDRENLQTMKLYSIPKAAEGLSTTANKKRAATAKSSLNVSAELEDVLKTLGRQFGVKPSSLNRMINKIAYHESAGTFDPQLKENTGGKVWNKKDWGAGLFQYKSDSVQTAINRAKRFYSRYNKTIPAWLKSLEKSLDIRDLNADQQKLLAILDMAAKPNFSIKNAVKDDDSLAQEWGRGWQTQSDPQKIKKFKQDTKDYNEYVGKEDSSDLAEQAPIAGLKVTDNNAGTKGFAAQRQEATPMSMGSNMATTPQSTIQPLSAQVGVDSLSRRTGVVTPKLQTFSSANANQTNEDDAWIRQILEFEAKSGSETGGGLTNWGYNNWEKFGHSRPPENIKEAIEYFKKDFLPKVAGYPLEIRKRLADYAYNSGRSIEDLLLFAAGKISLDDINSSKVFTEDWNKYKEEIQKSLNDPAFAKKLDSARHDVAKTTPSIKKDKNGNIIRDANGKPVRQKHTLENPNPAYGPSWSKRINMWTPQDTKTEQKTQQSTQPDNKKQPTQVNQVNQNNQVGTGQDSQQGTVGTQSNQNNQVQTNQANTPAAQNQAPPTFKMSGVAPSENTKNVTLYQTKNGVNVVRDSRGNVFLEKDGVATIALDTTSLFGIDKDISQYSNQEIVNAFKSKGGDTFVERVYKTESDSPFRQINLAPYGKSLAKGVSDEGFIDLPPKGGETRYKYRFDTTVPEYEGYSVFDTQNPDKGWTKIEDLDSLKKVTQNYAEYIGNIVMKASDDVKKGSTVSSPAGTTTKNPEFITTSSPRYINMLPQKGDPWEYRYDESTGTWETKKKDSKDWIRLDDSTENKKKAKQAIIDRYGSQLQDEVDKARGRQTTTPPPTEVAKPEPPKTGTTEAPKTEARTKVEETETLNPVERRLREWRKKQGVADPSSYDSTKSTPKQQGLESKYYEQQPQNQNTQVQTKSANQAQAPSQQDRSVAPLQPLPSRNISLESINRNNFNLQPQAAEEDEAQQPVRDYYGPPYVNGGKVFRAEQGMAMPSFGSYDPGQDILGGAKSGMQLGSQLGSFVPGIGQGIGALVGATIGGIEGGIMGAQNRAIERSNIIKQRNLIKQQQDASNRGKLFGMLTNMIGSPQGVGQNMSNLQQVLFQDGGDTSSPVYANATSPQTYGLQNNSALFQGFQQTPLLEMASLTYDSQDKKQEERIVDLYDASTKTLRKAFVDKNGSFIRWADTTAPAPPDRSVAPMPAIAQRPTPPIQPGQPSRPGDRTVPPAQPLPPRGAQPVQPGQQTPVFPRDRSVPSLPTLPPRPIQPVQPGQPVPPEDRTVPSLPTLPPRNVTPTPINPSVPTPTLPWQKIPTQPVQPSQEQPAPPENRVVEPLPPIAQRPTQPVQPGQPTRPVLPAPTPIQPREQQPVAEQPVEEQPADAQRPPSFKVQEGSYKVVNPATGQVEEVNPNDKNTTPSSKESTRNVGIYEFTWGGEDYQIIRDKSGRVFIESNGMIIPYVRSQGDSNFTSQTTTEEIINNIAQDSPNGFDESGNMRESAVQDYLRQYFGGELQKYGYIPSEDFYKGNYKRQKYKGGQVSQQQQGGPIITSLLYRNMDKNNSIKNNISMNKSKLESVINLSSKVNPYRLSPMGVYKNGGLIMEGGVSASRAGFSRQPITGASSTGPLGPKRSEVPSYTNKGVNSIMDLPTNEYVPTENMIPIQAEIGEMIVLPTGDLMPVMARRRHHQMQDDEVTDMTPENSYILSAHGQVRINKDEANLLITETGVKPYRLGQSQNPPTEKTLASVMTKKVMRPAEVAKRINSLFPVLSTDNPFEIAANIENKINRKPYLEGLIQLSELDKYRKGLSEPAMSDLQQQEMQMPQRMPGSPMLARQGRRISRPGLVTAQNGTGTGGNMVTLPPVGPSFIGSMYPRQIEMPQPGYSPGYWDAYAQRSQNPSEYLKDGAGERNLFSGLAAPANFAARLIGSQAIRGAEKAGIARERGIYDQGFGRIGNLMTAGTAAEAAMLGAQDPFVRWTDLPDTYIRSMQTQTPASTLEARATSAYANLPDYSEMGQAGLAAQNAAYARALQTGSEYAAQADERDRAAFNEQQRLLQQNLVANVTGRRQAQQATTAAINKMLSGYGNLANRFTQGQIDLTGQRMGANIGLSRAEQASKTGLYQNRLNAFTTFTGDMTAGGAEALKALFKFGG